VLFDFITIGYITKELFKNKWDGILCFILMVVFVSIKGIYNPIVSYPMYFSGSFLFILLSIYFTLCYKNTGISKYRTASVILYALGLLFYETYLLYLPLIIFIASRVHTETKSDFFSKFKKTLPYIIIGVTYCIVYFSYRLIHPSNYLGVSLSNNFSLTKFFNTILNFTSGSYPMALTFNGGAATYGGADYFLSDSIGNIIYFIISEHIEWIFKSIIVSILLYIILNKITFNKPKNITSIFFISLFFIFLPQLPPSLTEKYLSMGGLPNYVTTYFSVFAVTLCLTIIFIFLSTKIKNYKYRNLVYIAISIFIGLASICNDYSNYQSIKTLRVSKHALNFVDKFLTTKEYNSLPEKSFIYAPELFDKGEGFVHTNNGMDWSSYFYYKANKKAVTVSQSKDELLNEFNNKRSTYYINYGRNQNDIDQYIAFSTISKKSQIDSLRENIISDSTVIYYYSHNKTFSIIFNSLPDSSNKSIVINNDTLITKQNYIELDILNTNYKNNFMTVTIKSRNIDLKSIFVSNIKKSGGFPVSLD
jgi:hypothetical protein